MHNFEEKYFQHYSQLITIGVIFVVVVPCFEVNRGLYQSILGATRLTYEENAKWIVE